MSRSPLQTTKNLRFDHCKQEAYQQGENGGWWQFFMKNSITQQEALGTWRDKQCFVDFLG